MAADDAKKPLWITWERQVRNRSMAGLIGADYRELLCSRGRLQRYLWSARRTLALLWREQPTLVFCPNPSLVLTSLLLCARPFLGYKLVVDAHFGGVEAYDDNPVLQFVLDTCNRCADLVVVTNPEHRQLVEEVGGRAFVMPDPLPDMPGVTGGPVAAKQVFFICSFDVDEPYLEVFEAARRLAVEGFRLTVSGRFGKAGIIPDNFPHVSFLGFVDEAVYYATLRSCELAIDLTHNDRCLVCGAYEAVAAHKPVVLSDKPALRDYFKGGAVFVENDAESIADGIRVAYRRRLELIDEASLWAAQERRNADSRRGQLAALTRS